MKYLILALLILITFAGCKSNDLSLWSETSQNKYEYVGEILKNSNPSNSVSVTLLKENRNYKISLIDTEFKSDSIYTHSNTILRTAHPDINVYGSPYIEFGDTLKLTQSFSYTCNNSPDINPIYFSFKIYTDLKVYKVDGQDFISTLNKMECD